MEPLIEILNEFLERPELKDEYRDRLVDLKEALVAGDVSVVDEIQRTMAKAVHDQVKSGGLSDLLDQHMGTGPVDGFEYYTGEEEGGGAGEASIEDAIFGSDGIGGIIERTGAVSVQRSDDAERHPESLGGEGDSDEGEPGDSTGETGEPDYLEGLKFEEDALSDRFVGVSPMDILDVGSDEEQVLEEGRIQPPVRLENHMELLQDDLRKVAGVDVANEGDDQSIIIIRHGPHVIDVQRYPTRDVMELVGLIIKAIDEFDLDEVVIDCTGGWGAGVYARLVEQGIDARVQITDVKGNMKPRDDTLRALNARAEMYLLLQERFKKGGISLPMDKDLYRSIASIRYKISSDGGLFRIVPKKEIKSKTGRSPDEADALALCFYNEPPLEIY